MLSFFPVEAYYLLTAMSERALAYGCAVTQQGLVDAACVAERLGVSRDFVYAHAEELGVRRLGSGPRPRLRFNLAEIDAQLTQLTACSGSRGSEEPKELITEPLQRRSQRRGLGTKVALLPIRVRRTSHDA